MMKFEIRSTEVNVKEGTGKASGKPYKIRTQFARVEHDDEVRKVQIPLEEGQLPYAPGFYTFAPKSFRISEFGNVEIGRLALVPVGK